MAIITITSDLGDKDYYVPSLKAALLNLAPQAHLIDLSHTLPLFDILETAFLVKNAYHRFPEGSIHLIAVDPDSGTQAPVAMKMNGHFFIAPDNGILSLIRENEENESRDITNEELYLNRKGRSFFSLNFLVPAAAFLAMGGKFEALGEVSQIKELFWGEPSYSENALRGLIQHIDRFGNAVTNIKKTTFMDVKLDRSFQIFIRNVRLQRIISSYADVAKGEALALFGDHGLLEIAIREGSAQQLLGLKTHDMLTIEYYG